MTEELRNLVEGKHLNIPDSLRSKLPDDVFIFPGLVNAHDHLEFNLFPTLANKIYSDYIEWGNDIHTHNKREITEVLRIPLEQRLKFGILKNLVNGITRVVHHGGHHQLIKAITDFPVYLSYQYLHSLETERLWRFKLNNPFANRDLMLHVGEGSSDRATREIDKVIQWNYLKRHLVAIHAISLNPEQAHQFKSVLWCPDSNLLLYGKTLDVGRVKAKTKVLFGMDSTLSASADLWQQLRLALKLNYVSDIELLEMVTTNSYQHFYNQAFFKNDWVIARRRGETERDTFFNIQVEDILLVVINSSVWLCDNDIDASLRSRNMKPIRVRGKIKWVQPSLGEVVPNFLNSGISCL